MTAFEAEVDLDRLADFVGGALDGTPDADDVRHLVDSDTRWAEAYVALVTADAAIRSELGALGSEPLGVPDELGERLDAALAAAATARTTGGAVLELDQARERRKRRRQRWAVGLAAAAAALVCGTAGITVLRPDGFQSPTSSQEAGSSNQQDTAAAPRPPAEQPASGGQPPSAVLVTGNDYSAATVDRITRTSPPPAALSADGSNSGAKSTDLSNVAPDPLRRLAEPAARAACLDAILREYGGRVALVDLARFDGAPALIVLVDGARAAAGRRWVVAVGPTCGLGGAIADELYHGAV